MKTSEQTAKLDGAMLLVQKDLESVAKNKEVKVKGEKADWASTYATLDVLYDAAKEALQKHGVTIYQGGDYIQGGGERLNTRLAFEGEWIEASFPVKASREGAQGYGGGMTFARRWGLCCMLMLVPADLEEAQGYKDNKPAPRARPRTNVNIVLDQIRKASSDDALKSAANAARSAFPTGSEAAAVEQTIGAWFVTTANCVEERSVLTALEQLSMAVRPRGSEVHEAFRRAAERLP